MGERKNKRFKTGKPVKGVLAQRNDAAGHQRRGDVRKRNFPKGSCDFPWEVRSAVEFWRIKHSKRPLKPPRLEGPLFILSPSKILGQNCMHRKKVDFDAGTRQSAVNPTPFGRWIRTLCRLCGQQSCPGALYAERFAFVRSRAKAAFFRRRFLMLTHLYPFPFLLPS